MAKSGEFYTFDEVVRQLKIDENKLKRLVSEGEISAFREGDVMKFKKSEIDKLSDKGPGSETSETVLSEITLEDEAPAFEESGETLTDDLVFESTETGGDEVEIDADVAEPAMATDEISSQDTFIEDQVDEDVGMTTEPIDLSADLTQEVEEEEEEIEEIEAAPRTRAARPTRTRAVAEAPAGNPGITFCLVLSAIILLLGFTLAVRTGNNEIDGGTPLGDGMFKKMSGWFYDSFGTNEDVSAEIRKQTNEINSGYSSVVGGGGDTEG